ncbi:HNH endonuclease signature motif containing protein [Cellulomonas denverensis]|uniref:HNH endonuclease signature motif containing protein n=1 Tax=Cellulomonas denverensis TaxID=264297 RepID=UPI0035EA1D6A
MDDPVVAARTAAEQATAYPSMDPRAQVDSMLGAENGPVLAALLADIDLDAVDLLDLPEVAAAARRLESWAHAVAARVAAQLARRPQMNPDWPTAVHQPNTAPDELAICLGIGRRSARALVDEGLAYEQRLFGTGEALRTGRIDAARARVMVRALDGFDLFTVEDVEASVLPRAGERTPAQLARDIEKALLRIDPEGGARRHQRGRADRHVGRPTALGNGMAGIWACLPAPDATRLDHALNASAHALRRAGDPRTVAQLRADALLDAALVGPAWAPLQPDHHTHHDAGQGQDADAATGSCTCQHTGDGTGQHTDTDKSHDTTAGEGDNTTAGEGAGPAHRAPSVVPPRAEVRVTVALSTLIGADQEPADLDGHGPIDALTARALAAGGVWRRLVTDPLSGAVLDVGRTRYRPPKELADHVIARDRTCARPGCTVPATHCDLDHTIPYGDGGTTSAGNLAPLCRRDHLLRTHAGHRIEQTTAGQIVWTSLTRRFVSVPGRDGEHHRLPGRPGQPPGTDRRGHTTSGTDPADEVIPF